eukprot:4388447-Lingulodinium_polyedra.AAC.1
MPPSWPEPPSGAPAAPSRARTAARSLDRPSPRPRGRSGCAAGPHARRLPGGAQIPEAHAWRPLLGSTGLRCPQRGE